MQDVVSHRLCYVVAVWDLGAAVDSAADQRGTGPALPAAVRTGSSRLLLRTAAQQQTL